MKVLKSFFSASVIILLAACAKEIDQIEVIPDTSVTFTAEIAETETKTVLDYDKMLSFWSGDEYISVLNGQENYTFHASAPEPSAVVDFVLVDEKPYVPSDVVAVYPCSGNYALDKANMVVSGVSVPTFQKPLAGTYDVLAAVLMAYTADSDLYFKNTTSLIRFKVKDEGIWSVKFSANGGENMSGTYDLSWNDGSPLFLPVAAEGAETLQQNYVALSNGSEDTDRFTPGEYYYMAVVPGNYSQGFTVTMNDVEVHVTSEAKTLERNTIYELGELALPVAASWGICGTMNDWGNTGTPDFTLVEEGDWLVYKGLPVSFLDRFQFRADNEWGRQYGYREAVRAGETYLFADGGQGDIFVAEPAMYDVYLAKDFTSFKMEKVGNIEGKPVAKNWGVVGDMTGWGDGADPMADIAMTAEGNLYVARNVSVYKTQGFKFRVDNDWAVNLGCISVGEEPTLAESGSAYQVLEGGNNIMVSKSGVYDIFLSCYEDGFRMVKTADLEDPVLPEPEPEPEGENVTVYFKPSNSWSEGSVTFAAWVWKTGGEGSWYLLEDSDSDGVYEATFPENMDNIIFASMKGAADWKNKVYQTGDLKVPADDKTAYVAYDDTWRTLDEAKAYVEPAPDTGIVRIYVNSEWGWNFGLWCWDSSGTQIFAGNAWPGKKYEGNETVGGVSYVYWTVPEAYVGKTVNLLVTKINGSNADEQSADYMNVNLSTSVYFDMNWTEEKGVHLVKK